MILKRRIVHGVLFFLPTVAVAAGPFHGLAMGGVTGGGDTVFRVAEEDLQAGGSWYVAMGFTVEPAPDDFFVQTTFGYRYGSAGDDWTMQRGSVSAAPVDLIGFFRSGPWRLGAGLSYHYKPRFKSCASPALCRVQYFDDALGMTFEIDYQTPGRPFFGLRYTAIDYLAGQRTIDASHIGVFFGFRSP